MKKHLWCPHWIVKANDAFEKMRYWRFVWMIAACLAADSIDRMSGDHRATETTLLAVILVVRCWAVLFRRS